MAEIKSWAVVLCVSLVISSVLLFIAPEGRLKKFFGYVVSVFILTVVFIPLTKTDFSVLTDFDTDEFYDNNEEYSHMLTEYIYDSGEQVLKDTISKELDMICTDEYSVFINFKDISSAQIEIKSISIKIHQSDMNKISVIRKKVGELTGIIPEVNVIELQSSY